MKILLFAVLGSSLIILTACSSMPTPSASASQCLPSSYMPDWSATRFDEAEATAGGVLSRPYHDAVAAARHHDREALEEVISCSYSRYCDAAAGELHSGVLQQLLLAWGDIDFSHALAVVKSRHGGHYPSHSFLLYERDIRRFFPLTARVLYDT